MKIVPYLSPLQPSFKLRAFREATLRAKAALEPLLFQDDRFIKGLQDIWVHYVPKRQSGGPRTSPWMPKLYVCLGPGEYWPMVRRLVKSFRGGVSWKFLMAPDGYDRPDKIVVYGRSEAHLRQIVRAMRPLMPRRGFHALHHSASTAALGLERAGSEGLYVGIDTPFRESWRAYRAVCVAWADWNDDYLRTLPGGRARWFERMNLSTKHEGPRSLTPPARDFAYAKRYWKLVKPEGF